jgi:hypothetical protein
LKGTISADKNRAPNSARDGILETVRRRGQRLDFLRPRFAFRFVFFIAFFLPRFFVFFVARFLAAFFLAAGLVDADGGAGMAAGFGIDAGGGTGMATGFGIGVGLDGGEGCIPSGAGLGELLGAMPNVPAVGPRLSPLSLFDMSSLR